MIMEKETYKVKVDIKQDLKINFTVLTALGLWMPESYRGTVKGLLYHMYSCWCFVWMVVCPILSEIIDFILVFGDIQKMVENLFFSLTHLGWAWKVYNILRYHSRFKAHFDTVEEPIFCRVDVESAHSMRTMTRRNYATTVIFITISASTCLNWALFPLLKSSGVVLPIPAWFPVDQNKTLWFGIIYVYQVVTTYYLAMSNNVLDTLVSASIAVACGQLDVLSDKLSDKYCRIESRRNHLYICEGEDIGDETLIEYNLQKHLIDCVEHHMEIVDFVKDSETLFSSNAFLQFFVSCVILCFTAFKLTLVDTTSEFSCVFLYMVCMLIELFIYSYFGNELIIKSRQLSNAAYCSQWYDMSIQNRKYIMILMERAKRPLQVTAVIFILSLDTFTSVLRSSYSYFAVLQRVNNR